MISSVRGTTTCFAAFGSAGSNHDHTAVAAKAPSNCATMNPGASAGRIPENVLVTERAKVTAGFANEVEANLLSKFSSFHINGNIEACQGANRRFGQI